MHLTRQERRLLAKENAKRPATLTEVPRSMWPDYQPATIRRVWVSRDYLVQEHHEGEAVRLSVCRTSHNGTSWDDGITWDELQAVKAAVGYGSAWAVECYPPDRDVVNVANIHHLWILPGPPVFGWKQENES